MCRCYSLIIQSHYFLKCHTYEDIESLDPDGDVQYHKSYSCVFIQGHKVECGQRNFILAVATYVLQPHNSNGMFIVWDTIHQAAAAAAAAVAAAAAAAAAKKKKKQLAHIYRCCSLIIQPHHFLKCHAYEVIEGCMLISMLQLYKAAVHSRYLVIVTYPKSSSCQLISNSTTLVIKCVTHGCYQFSQYVLAWHSQVVQCACRYYIGYSRPAMEPWGKSVYSRNR